MAEGYVFMATTIDGYIARENDEIDFLMKYDPQGEDHGYDKFIEDKDAIVMGSGSFKTILGFDSWPYTLPVYVMSKNMKDSEVPEHLKGKVFLSAQTPEDLMNYLADKGLNKLYIDGGKLVSSFIEKGLIKEMTLTILPILLGKGRSLFQSFSKDIDLKLIKNQSFKCGFVQNTYQFI